MKKQKSPCIDLCNFSGPNSWCLGCARTRPECSQWKKMKPYDRNRIEKELQKRMNQIKKTT
ncbi:DUF1289 domain-containing protein [Marinomonas colpomeniae]|uniref:DUF1289 domain-containing protein n=1 Tax=Marinomonas colpomeniae TaxID=2774408 RepID=A0ABR8NU54_9GAMM|nr:DUF1289 domain-containing protein [Marinomonas colpomeniae]MBD5769587.1 DUF1289 domain-containing protein [Marinomonas colpomeniae]